MLEQLAIGLHLATYHFDRDTPLSPAHRLRDDTPGLYVKTDDWVVMVVRNSFGRWSLGAGGVWTFRRADFTLGAMTGYKYRTERGPDACPSAVPERLRQYYGDTCVAEVGATRAVLRPFAAASYLFQTGTWVEPRLSVIGKGVSLSLEKKANLL